MACISSNEGHSGSSVRTNRPNIEVRYTIVDNEIGSTGILSEKISVSLINVQQHLTHLRRLLKLPDCPRNT